MKLAVIPARGGSKRIPRKNIKPFCELPMIAWSIAAARESGCFDRIIVSTDDEEIAGVARQYGAEVPFLRPTELSGDHAGTIAVIAHAVGWQAAHGAAPAAACCIYATAPFIQPADVREAWQALEAKDCDYVFSVTRYSSPIQRALRVTPAGRLEMFHPELFHTRSQDLEEAFHDAAQFYWGRPQAWLAGTPVFSPRSVPLILPSSRVQDIDTPEDWERAELMFAALRKAATP